MALPLQLVYGSAQQQFLEFCSQDIPSDLGQPLLLASEQTLMRFCAHLADRLHHSSIKVYLSAVRSLHIDYDYPDPLSNCLQLQRLLRGIKRHQGSNLPQRQACDCFGHEPHSLRAGHCLAWRSFGMVWGLMAGLLGFASHGSSLHLGAGCQ